MIFSSTGGTKAEGRPKIIQAIEVTPQKKVVWVLQDWKHLGPATTAQFLDQLGIPERPVSCNTDAKNCCVFLRVSVSVW